MSLSKNINPSLVQVLPRQTCPFITERLLMGGKESNQTTTALEQTAVKATGGGGLKLILLAIYNKWLFIDLKFVKMFKVNTVLFLLSLNMDESFQDYS